MGVMAGDEHSTNDERQAAMRGLPSVNALVEAVEANGRSRAVVVDAARRVIDRHRDEIARGRAAPLATEILAAQVAGEIERAARPPLRPVINATGILVHTGLGRAPLADEVVDSLGAVAAGYAPVEIDLVSGRRGERAAVVRDLLRRLTGAEDAAVVNNNAAALVLVLAALASRRGVIVSRGELIEIGGSFRLPEIMETSGAILREVGTTNRTRPTDYERAIDETTALLLKVHPSNYRVEGFRAEASISEVAAIGRRRGLPVVYDIGSGALRPLAEVGGPASMADEPDAPAAIAAGADLVLFSGDKLIGGPQAGIIAGRADLVREVARHPLMRAMRVGKLTLAALGATLALHLDPETARQRLPVFAMLSAPQETLERRGIALRDALAGDRGLGRVEVEPSASFLGGGSVPTRSIPSRALVIRESEVPAHELARRLRAGEPAVVARINRGALVLDLRTVAPEQDEPLVEALRAAMGR
jgi:L-seryl-tRNA(Ser) seleniumtransferase